MTAPRIVVRGATFSATRRTTFRKAFLAPWDPRVMEAWKYSVAYAQQEYEVDLHMAAVVINHHHLEATLRRPNLGAFLHRAHHDISCSVNTLMKHERYDAPKELWDKRSTHVMRELDAAAQASSGVYVYTNTVAAGLVARPEDMPDGAFDFGLWKTGGMLVKRPEFYFGKNRPSELWLRYTPPPLLMQAFDGDLDALVYHMRKVSEEAIRALREARKGRPPMGAAKLRDIHPWMEPKTLAERGGGLVPAFKVGARGIVGRRMAGDAAREVSGWRYEHRSTRLARVAVARGEREPSEEQVFPYGTYEERVLRGAPVAERPMEGAIVSAPGPLLEEVLADLRERPAGPGARAAVMDEVRAAWTEESAEVADHEELDLDEATRPARSSDVSEAAGEAEGASDAPRRPEPKVRHRFDPDEDRGGRPHPRRVITKRDRRRRKLRRRGRSDPPA